MLECASKSSTGIHLNFKPGKCQLVHSRAGQPERHTRDLCVNFCGQSVEGSDSALHLGHYIGLNHDVEIVSRAINDLYRRTNSLLMKFSHCTSDRY